MDYKNQIRKLNYIINGINASYGKLAQKYGINYNALMMLNVLEEKKCTQKEICDILLLPKSTVHGILLDYVKKGYMTLEAGTNKKEKLITFTESGKAYMQQVMNEVHSVEIKAMEALGDEQCRQLMESNLLFYEAFKNEVEHE